MKNPLTFLSFVIALAISSMGDTASSLFTVDTRCTAYYPVDDEYIALVPLSVVKWGSVVFTCDTGGFYFDRDGDGIPNWWESKFSSSGSKTSLAAESDDDYDGMSNLAEFMAGTIPTNETSRFTAKIEMRDGAPLVTWEPDLNENGTKSERLYKVYGSETLEDGGVWQYPTNSLHRFFKVTVEMP